MSSSGYFEVEDARRRNQRDDDHTTPSTTGLSGSQLSTPIMSHQKALALLLNTPPSTADSGCDPKINVVSLENDSNTEDAPTNALPLPSQHTPSMFSSRYDNNLEPPAWKPPEAEEIEYTDAWNNIYNNHHHYLQPGLAAQQDDSTIGSSQTNTSLANNVNLSSSTNMLRPRGLSLCSYADDPSVGSCPQPSHGQHSHRRHPSLPVSFFSSASQQGSNQQLFTSPQKGSQSQVQTSKQILNLLQTTTKATPYEPLSHHNISQVQADGAMAGLSGILLDLYTVDRAVDSASAKMLATKVEDRETRAHENGKDDSILRKKGGKHSSPRKPRKTAVGTLSDIQCILELHKVDKTVDRFKQDLQMPEFFEEEAWESNVWKDLRRTDVEMEEYSRKKKLEENIIETQQKEGRISVGLGDKENVQYQFDLSDDEEGVVWNSSRQELGGEGIYVSTESHLTDYDAYQFFDPHETDALQANSYQSSQVSTSINDDLHEIIDLLRTDVEVDGASKHHTEMEMVRPLLEVDREMDKLKARSKVKDMWDGDLKALYLMDLTVDGATKKYSPKPQKMEADDESADLKAEATINSIAKQDPITSILATKSSAEKILSTDLEVKTTSIDAATEQQDQMAPVHGTKSSTDCTDQEVKTMLSQHIPTVSHPFCPTSPELVASKAAAQAAGLTLPPTSAPIPSPQQSTRRAIFSTREKSNANMMPKPVPAKRSIFSRQEKSSAKSQCAFRRGVMMPGTTTVVLAKGGEMIGDIPVGKVVITDNIGGAIR